MSQRIIGVLIFKEEANRKKTQLEMLIDGVIGLVQVMVLKIIGKIGAQKMDRS